jgi:DNA polymerase I-like protein with 3'-5' exonuclease and polymerase domains
MKSLDNKKAYYLIEDATDVEIAIMQINLADVVAFDTETTGLNVRKEDVIGFSFSTAVNEGFYFPLMKYNQEHDALQICAPCSHKPLLEALSKKKLIMHNASFDTRVVFNALCFDLIDSLYADTMLMRHTLTEEGPFGLKDIAVELASKIGISEEEVANQEQLELEDNVKSKGGSWTKTNKEIYKGDIDILAKYACADTDLTLRLFNYFQAELEKQNLLSFFYEQEVMPLYKFVTIIMEHEGVHLDMPRLESLYAQINTELKQIEANVVQALLDTAEGQQFVKQRLAEEFAPSNKGSFAQEVCRFFDLDLPKLASGKYQINQKTLQNSSAHLRAKLFLENTKSGLLEYEIQEIQKRLLIAKEGTEHAINISSKQQLGTIVFDLMGIAPLTRTEKGAGQFNEDFIEHLAEQGFTWAKELRVYNKLNKIKGSYYERFLNSQEGGVFFPTFKQHGTTSGRYGSDMQQLSRPLEEGSDDARIVFYTNTLRELIIPKEDYVFIDDDYESLEPRVFADDAGDQALIDIFELGEDFYSKVAIGTEGLQGVSAHKKDPNFLKNLHPEVRQNAKAYSLGIRYGMKAGKLAMALNISKEDAQEKIDSYFKNFPGLKSAMDNYLAQAKLNGRVVSKYGRVRHLPRVKEIHNKYGDGILDYDNLKRISTKTFTPISTLKDIRKEYNNLLNNALNFPIQAAATSIVNRAMIAMSYKFRQEGLDAWVSLQIHDQVVVSCHKNCIDRVKEIVQDCMENTNKLAMKLIAKPEVANNLREGH